MNKQLFQISTEELRQFEELLRNDEDLKDEKISKIELIILYKLQEWEKRYSEFKKRWATPIIHLDEKL